MVIRNCLSLGCELDQPEAKVEMIRLLPAAVTSLCGAAEFQATLQSNQM